MTRVKNPTLAICEANIRKGFGDGENIRQKIEPLKNFKRETVLLSSGYLVIGIL